MKTGIIVGLIIVALLVAGGIVWMRNQTPAVSLDETATVDDEFVTETGPDFVQEVPSDAPVLATSPSATTGSPAAGTQQTEREVIRFNDTGATPATLTVAAGTTVRFVNDGQVPRWPASDVHPTHEILPDFDAERGLQTGEEYTHTFTQPGTWRWHDHLHPNVVGTITVTAAQ